jgi:hypothetical protein
VTGTGDQPTTDERSEERQRDEQPKQNRNVRLRRSD